MVEVTLKLPATNELDKFRNLLDNKDKLVKQEDNRRQPKHHKPLTFVEGPDFRGRAELSGKARAVRQGPSCQARPELSGKARAVKQGSIG